MSTRQLWSPQSILLTWNNLIFFSPIFNLHGWLPFYSSKTVYFLKPGLTGHFNLDDSRLVVFVCVGPLYYMTVAPPGRKIEFHILQALSA
jgi:hypothetical protein